MCGLQAELAGVIERINMNVTWNMKMESSISSTSDDANRRKSQVKPK
jgi:hypothetical protein